MRVLVVSPFGTTVNPYIGLFAAGLRDAGADAGVVRALDLPSLSSGARPDVIHLHWIEQYGPPPALRPRSHIGQVSSVQRIALRSVNSGPLYQLRRWQRLRTLLDALAAFQQAGGRVAYTVHNLDPHEAGSWAERWALKQIIASASILHVHDATTAGELERRYGRRDRITVIPHGHYLDAYPNQISQPEARRRLRLPDDGCVFVCLGLMRPYKGLEELLPVFRNLWGNGLRLVVAGRPPNRAYVDRLCALTGGDPRITLEPRFIPAEEVQVYLKAADAAVLPYRQITTSGAAFLAFSFGLPVVAPAIGAFPSLVTTGSGVLYAPGELAVALEVAAQRDWSGSHESIMSWVGQFDWGEIGRRLLEAYNA